MKARLLFIFLFTFSFYNSVKGQDLVVYEKFDELEKALFKENDTLYVVNFWATWCAPCVKELPYFEAFSKENSNQKVKVILVSLDFEKQKDSKLIPFLKKKKITSDVVLLLEKDYNNWLPKVDKNWSGSIPATLLIKGNKRQFAEQEFESENDLKNYINTFINP
jgi:thiol-disulfide isomerase/thioredoxin